MEEMSFVVMFWVGVATVLVMLVELLRGNGAHASAAGMVAGVAICASVLARMSLGYLPTAGWWLVSLILLLSLCLPLLWHIPRGEEG